MLSFLTLLKLFIWRKNKHCVPHGINNETITTHAILNDFTRAFDKVVLIVFADDTTTLLTERYNYNQTITILINKLIKTDV